MHPLLGLGLLLAAGIAVTHVSLPAGSWLRRPIPGAGTIAWPLAAGLLLGPGLGVLDAAALRGLAPLTAVAIGWIGAAIGARLPALFHHLPRHEWTAAAAVAAVTFVASTLTALLVVRLVPAVHEAWRPILPALVTFGAVGTMSQASSLGSARRVTWLAMLFGLAVFALVLAFYRAGGIAPARGLARLLALLACGGGLGVGAVWLARLREGDAPWLELAAVVLIGAGLGMATRLSPFLLCLLAGMVIGAAARRSSSRSVAQARRALLHWEPLAATLMLLLAGALLRLPLATWWLVPAAVALLIARIGSRWVLLRQARAWPPLGRLAPTAAPAPGAGGIGQGAPVIALALSHELAFLRPAGGGDAMGSAILATLLAGALLAQAAARALAGRSGAPSLARPLTAAAPRAEVT